ncbi:hypothetical protein NA57DRAFT_74204 [Rhizodiscina lignyota]|uniref:Uncharacterized protein n=1 Tax=Rhizodiscina lignyota TaxID=1504668 RepID=A0A9P4MAQ9_9PEZI|nr:hypothetical protein NA57DRAFT_74204 [Rhizodiscina lignyota]
MASISPEAADRRKKLLEYVGDVDTSSPFQLTVSIGIDRARLPITDGRKFIELQTKAMDLQDEIAAHICSRNNTKVAECMALMADVLLDLACMNGEQLYRIGRQCRPDDEVLPSTAKLLVDNCLVNGIGPQNPPCINCWLPHGFSLSCLNVYKILQAVPLEQPVPRRLHPYTVWVPKSALPTATPDSKGDVPSHTDKDTTSEIDGGTALLRDTGSGSEPEGDAPAPKRRKTSKDATALQLQCQDGICKHLILQKGQSPSDDTMIAHTKAGKQVTLRKANMVKDANVFDDEGAQVIGLDGERHYIYFSITNQKAKFQLHPKQTPDTNWQELSTLARWKQVMALPDAYFAFCRSRNMNIKRKFCNGNQHQPSLSRWAK